VVLLIEIRGCDYGTRYERKITKKVGCIQLNVPFILGSQVGIHRLEIVYEPEDTQVLICRFIEVLELLCKMIHPLICQDIFTW
jgi:hypothetical protein